MPDSKDVFRQSVKRRAIVMEIGGFQPPENPKASWFGKVAFGLPGEEWPMVDDNLPMIPLAQINLAELPFCPPRLEDVEFLTIFIDPDTDGGDENGSTWCVRAYPNLDALAPLEAPEELASDIIALPMRPKVIEEDYPCYDNMADDIPDDVAESYENDFENVSGFKLGGWPSLIQGPIHWPSEADKIAQPEYVFQIDSTEEGQWIWGDGGVAYFGRGTAPDHEDEWFFVWQSY
jgi:uncharacterized protein YwqG